MLHLTADRLAALADEQPNEIEAAHLAACPACRRECDAQLRLRELARYEAARPARPLTTWEGVEAALRRADEGAAAVPSVGRRRGAGALAALGLPQVARRLAAAAALLTVGMAAGRYSAGAAPLAFGERAAADTARTVVAYIAGATRDTLSAFQSTEDAVYALTRAERQYQLAANYLAAHDSTGEPAEDSSALYRARLAALDEVMAATRAALYEAPHDPVINRYYLATLGAREITVRQLGTSLPAGQSVSRF